MICLIFIYIFVLFGKWKKQGKDILFINTVVYIYLCFVAFFTLMPFIVEIPHMFGNFRPMNLTPFVDVLMGRGDFVRQIVLNMLMTVPFGFLFPLTGKGNAGTVKTILCCFLMSLGIELLQGFLGLRSSDITDIITNVTGGIIGYLLYLVFRPLTTRMLAFLRGKS